MSHQLDLFAAPALTPGQLTDFDRKRQADAQEAERRRKEGMQRAADNKHNQLGYARGLAVDLAKANGGECHADMVAEALAKEGRPGLGNAAGSLFLPKVWEDSGKVFKSERPESHRNKLVVWRLRYMST